ncbi:flagellar motor protein MotB [Ewingella americana]|jgi:chemotaxis protein MotB|uniref:MotB family flagellar motor rotation protein n=2 Tax=Ewingella americana TaxID=41202 RepID=A0A085GHE2_EWIA3|nr:flagellar motor protein MotB [Ewingella americana]KAA8729524.1 flagellar motor protein MotB [Ewingella americana]KFC83137.1 MotB family flagellar motor rotation protein [Ewingella americana ATCC 33852]MRT04126.1 flagellar motor protein MotB [Ewingella americana]STQ44980.1 Chemotaxis protein MotB [Ewingella americana]
MKHQSHPIVVVRRKKGKHGGGHHGGSWKIAYADFMTAMMAFFLVMWLISISSPKELVQIAEYFRTPLAVAITNGPRSSDATSPIPGGGDDPTQQDGEVHKMIQSQGDQREIGDLQRLQEKLEQMLISDPRLKDLRPHLMINLTEQGLRIQIIDSQNRPMFQLGSATVEPYMRYILRAIAPVLDDFPNKISLAGHTDDMPYAMGERGYSNWELSTDRANASRRELTAGGLSEGKVLRVMGMGSTMQLKDHPSGDAINRRISILVLNKHAEEAIERENSEGEAVTISDAGELKKMVPGNDTAAPAPVEPPSAKASSAFAPHLTSKEPAAESTTPPTSGQSLPTQPSQEQQQPKSETVTPVGSSSSNRPTTAVPAAADVTAQPASSASRDSQQR